MSTSSISTINLPGGLPSHSDLAPAIIFIIAFFALIGIWTYRLINPQSRSTALVRLGIFMFIQQGFLITRVILAKQAPELSKGLTIANLVLVLAGTLLLLEPPITLWKNYLEEHIAEKGRKHWVWRVSLLLQLLLLTTIAIATYTGSAIGGLIDSPTEGKLKTFRGLRLASYVLALAIVIILAAGIVATHIHYRLEVRKTGFLLACLTGIFVICLFRLISGETTSLTSPVHSKAAFWTLQVCFSWLTCALFLSVNLKAWFPSAKDVAKEEARKEGETEMGNGMEMGRKGSGTSSVAGSARR